MHMHHFTILVLLCTSPKGRSNFELQYEKEAFILQSWNRKMSPS